MIINGVEYEDFKIHNEFHVNSEPYLVKKGIPHPTPAQMDEWIKIHLEDYDNWWGEYNPLIAEYRASHSGCEYLGVGFGCGGNEDIEWHNDLVNRLDAKYPSVNMTLYERLRKHFGPNLTELDCVIPDVSDFQWSE